MPRRRLFTNGRLTAVVLFAGIIGIIAISRRTPEAYYQGHSASYWLRQLFGAKRGLSRVLAAADAMGTDVDPSRGATRGPTPALEAFENMGTNADPVLVAALRGRENPFIRLYRGVWARLPTALQDHLPIRDDPWELRMEAVIVFQHAAPNRPMPNLYEMLKEPDSGLRLAVLNATENRIPDANQISLLLLAGNDPDTSVRQEVWHRLEHIGASASNALPFVLKLCSDDNINVRQDAAWALWNITGQTNTAVPVIESALSRSLSASRRHQMAYHLLMMGDSAPFFVATLVNSLTNNEAGDRVTVCSFLREIGPPASSAIPALRKALQDPEPEVRRRAEVALSRIDPEHAATNSP
jgi:HEAT repeat protein